MDEEHVAQEPAAQGEVAQGGVARGAAMAAGPLSREQLDRIHAWWRAANYLSVGQIYLMGNPLLLSRCARSTSSPGCSGTGGRRRG